jgi:chemotaxis protein CheX
MLETGPDPAAIEEIVTEIFVGLIGEDEIPPYPMPYDGSELTVSASVSVTGEWSGHVVVACGADLGRQIAAGFLMADASDINDDDLSDAMGEFANVVGGSVKSMMPGPSKLSLPVAVIGPSRERLPGAVETSRAELTWHDAPIVVSVWAAEHHANANTEETAQ